MIGMKWKRRLVLVVAACVFLSIPLLLYGLDPPKAKAMFSVGPVHGSSPFITIFPPVRHANRTDLKKDTAVRENGNVKTLLLWTPFFGSKSWATTPDTFRACRAKACRTTANKSEVDTADALIINIRDIYSPADLPPHHPPHQIWIIHGSEPPYYIYLNLDKLNDIFNWTSWYRSDADIFSPYGTFHAATSSQHIEAGSHSQPADAVPAMFETPDFESKSLPPLPNIVADPFSLHDRMIFWAASSCINPSQRYKMVAKIAKHLPVDTYGFCGKLTCTRGASECEATLKRYKFVLAFENGYCRDYLTEKYWNALERHQIPIVSGGADYAQLAIPGSYIDVDNFTSVQELVDFVRRVGSDRALYNSFFQWQWRYQRVNYGITNWCKICQALHDDSKTPQTYSNFKGWLAQDSCPLYADYQPFVWAKQYVVFKLFGI